MSFRILNEREMTVLRLLAEGYTDAMIAAELHSSITMTSQIVLHVRYKLNARNRAHAVNIAWQRRLLTPADFDPHLARAIFEAIHD